MEEIWKDIEGYEGIYQVSNLGNVRSLNYNHTKKEKALKPELNRDGYLQIHLCKNGKKKWKKIHRLVAFAFIKNKNNYPIINHKDGNKLNNNVNNLEWCTQSYNCKEAYRLGLQVNARKRKVLQYDLDGNFLGEFESLICASKYIKRSYTSIISNIKNKTKQCGGYVWKYKEK